MRSSLTVLAIAVALMAACEQAPTATRQQRAPSEPDALLFGSQWTASSLPFAPSGINDSRVVVGRLGSEAISWQNGTLRALLHITTTTFPQEAIAISPHGKIVGHANDSFYSNWILVWQSQTEEPKINSYLFDNGEWPFLPVAINDSGAFLASWGWTNHLRVIRETPGVGQRDISVSNSSQTKAAGMNNAGFAAGTYWEIYDSTMTHAVRWNPAGVYTVLPSFGGKSLAEAINGRGDVIGSSGLGTTIWLFDGTFTTVSGLPANRTITGWNDAGRIVGNAGDGRPYTYYKGTLTYLPTPETNPYPTVMGVNSCGVIIGRSNMGQDAGFLWARSGISAVCDASVATGGT